MTVLMLSGLPAGYPTPGPADYYDLQGVAGVGQEARKPSIHTLLNPLKCENK